MNNSVFLFLKLFELIYYYSERLRAIFDETRNYFLKIYGKMLLYVGCLVCHSIKFATYRWDKVNTVWLWHLFTCYDCVWLGVRFESESHHRMIVVVWWQNWYFLLTLFAWLLAWSHFTFWSVIFVNSILKLNKLSHFFVKLY